MPENRSAHHIEMAYFLAELETRQIDLSSQNTELQSFAKGIVEGENFSAKQMQTQLGRLLQLVPDDGVGLRAGDKVGVKDYGAFGHAYLSSRNLRAVHELILTYRRILRTIHDISIEYRDDHFKFSVINLQATGPVGRFFVEAWLMTQFNGMNILLGETDSFDSVYLAYEPPSYAGLYEEIFQCPVQFGQGTSGFKASSRLLDQPFSYANEDVRQFCEQQCLQLMREMDAGQETVNRARELLLRNPGWFPTCDELAGQMGFSSRTLRRRLQQESSSFQKVFDSVRKELSANYLRTTEMTVEMIAYRLGYEEANSFYKAFRRWYGTSPKAFARRN